MSNCSLFVYRYTWVLIWVLLMRIRRLKYSQTSWYNIQINVVFTNVVLGLYWRSFSHAIIVQDWVRLVLFVHAQSDLIKSRCEYGPEDPCSPTTVLFPRLISPRRRCRRNNAARGASHRRWLFWLEFLPISHSSSSLITSMDRMTTNSTSIFLDYKRNTMPFSAQVMPVKDSSRKANDWVEMSPTICHPI